MEYTHTHAHTNTPCLTAATAEYSMVMILLMNTNFVNHFYSVVIYTSISQTAIFQSGSIWREALNSMCS